MTSSSDRAATRPSRRTRRLGVGVVALAATFGLLASACGTDDGDDTVAGAPPADTTVDGAEPVDGTEPVDGDTPVESPPLDPNAPVDPPLGPGEGYEVAEPTGNAADPRARPFDSVEVDEDDRTVRVYFYSGIEPCYVLDRVEVDESDTSVTITLFEGSDPTQPDVACIEIAVSKVTVVTLDQPVGDRTIVDGAA